MNVKKFFIITNKEKDPDNALTGKIIEYIENKGMTCQCSSPEMTNTTNDLAGDYRYTNAAIVPDDTDCIIVLGGDGTLIQAADDLNGKDIPLLGVNIGTLGFLTDTDMDCVFKTIDLITEGRYEIDIRMMLEGTIYSDGQEVYKNTALNDIVINRCSALKIVEFNIIVNGEYLNSYHADGVIISTATGSTAYSLSAGGPLIQPNAQLLMITPICPHTLNRRSIILGADDEITIEICNSKKYIDDQMAFFDGESYCKMASGDRIIIKRAAQVVKFIKTNKLSFVQRIRNKM